MSHNLGNGSCDRLSRRQITSFRIRFARELKPNHTPNQAHTQPNHAKDHKEKHDRIGVEHAQISVDPRDRTGNDSTDMLNDLLHGQSRQITSILDLYHPLDQLGNRSHDTQGDKITHRFSHQKGGKLAQEGRAKINHRLDRNTPQRRKTQ